ncbi:MAG: SidA/IucD/PvdA family monooxygenase [Sporichthyaceae bacterium]|nr:SidA/IucD/PvdA family monooxygenase [Sporichthyaceae bacterium]
MSAERGAYDLIGVGVGPFNLSLAALADPVPDLSAIFLDAKPDFAWHPGMLIDGTTVQVPFLADLVSLVDPTNWWSFLSYLRVHGRLFPFYFSQRWHPGRREYNDYCRWAAQSLDSCRFGWRVEAVRPSGDPGFLAVECAELATGRTERLLARNLVLGVGTEPSVPQPFAELITRHGGTKRVFHSADYLDYRGGLDDVRDITVVGSGQSGAEVFLDLLRAQADRGWRLRWLTRSPAFAPMEYSKLGLEHFTPDYVRYFRTLPQSVRDAVVPAQWQLYRAIDANAIAEIFDLLYDRAVGNAHRIATLMPQVEVRQARAVGLEEGFELDCRHVEQGRQFSVITEAVVLATGYAPRRPDCLAPLAEHVDWDGFGRYQVDDDHRVKLGEEIGAGLYVQNAELHTHGVGSPDLGLGAYRAARVLNAISGRTVYELPKRVAFTSFGVGS